MRIHVQHLVAVPESEWLQGDALYRLLRHLGPAGEPAPAWMPPNQAPQGPFVQFPAPPQ